MKLKLRFKGFSGAWVEKKMGDIAPLQRGFDLPIQSFSNGLYPVVYSNGILRFHKNFKVIGPGVITGRSGTIGQVTYVDTNYWPHNTTLWVTNFKNNHPKFIYYLYSQLNLKKFSCGSGVPTLNRNDIHVVKTYISLDLAEQQKIADFLSLVDVKIEKMGTKIELLKTYKKGMMQQIFSQKLRFKQDDGSDFPEWEEKKLGEILEYEQPSKYIVQNTTYDDSFSTPVLTAGKSFILGFSNETNDIFTQVPIILFDDFTTDSRYIDFPFKVKSSAIKILKLKDPLSDLKFVFEMMNNIQAPKGDHKRYWISEYQQIFIPYPSLPEQQNIAALLSSLDQQIDLLTQQHALLIQQKKSYLSALL